MAVTQERLTTNPKPQIKGKNPGKKILLWIAITLVVIFCLAPVMWQLLTSFKLNQDIAKIPTVYFPTR
ncbi:MAG: carbohydrate ABC transporter permease, partial [Microcoleus sp. SIO2G3]|nr:carbohydrate ABC transporter permease [Microcoleus sp. SIO2G3]